MPQFLVALIQKYIQWHGSYLELIIKIIYDPEVLL